MIKLRSFPLNMSKFGDTIIPTSNIRHSLRSLVPIFIWTIASAGSAIVPDLTSNV